MNVFKRIKQLITREKPKTGIDKKIQEWREEGEPVVSERKWNREHQRMLATHRSRTHRGATEPLKRESRRTNR